MLNAVCEVVPTGIQPKPVEPRALLPAVMALIDTATLVVSLTHAMKYCVPFVKDIVDEKDVNALSPVVVTSILAVPKSVSGKPESSEYIPTFILQDEEAADDTLNLISPKLPVNVETNG